MKDSFLWPFESPSWPWRQQVTAALPPPRRPKWMFWHHYWCAETVLYSCCDRHCSSRWHDYIRSYGHCGIRDNHHEGVVPCVPHDIAVNAWRCSGLRQCNTWHCMKMQVMQSTQWVAFKKRKGCGGCNKRNRLSGRNCSTSKRTNKQETTNMCCCGQ